MSRRNHMLGCATTRGNAEEGEAQYGSRSVYAGVEVTRLQKEISKNFLLLKTRGDPPKIWA